MNKHTPGPWTKVDHNWSQTSIVTRNRTICRLDITDEATEETEQALAGEAEANANLIAAAPQMLEALEELEPFLQWLVIEQGDKVDKLLENKILPAIKAAKGEA